MNKLFILAFFFVSCSQLSFQSEDEKFHALLKKHHANTMKSYPEFATMQNYKDGAYDHLWTDLSPQAMKERDEMALVEHNEILAIKRSQLSDKEKLNYDLYKNMSAHGLAGIELDDEYLRIDQLSGFHLGIAQVLARMPQRKKKDFLNMLARLQKVPTVIEQNLVLLKEGLKRGATPPRITLRDVPAQFDSLLVSDMNKNPMTRTFARAQKHLSKSEYKKFKRDTKAALKKAIAKLKEAKKYVKNVYILKARKSIAAESLPNGKKWYAHAIKGHTTTDLTPKEIHEIGLKEVKRIKKEMDKVIKRTKFKGSFASFLKHLNTHPKFFYRNKEDLLKNYRDIAKIADGRLLRVFNTLPRTPYGIEPTPQYMEKSAPTAYYYGGNIKAARSGIFYANTYDLKSRPKWEMVALTLHEAMPGHHLQISIADELEDVPVFRKYSRYTAFIEGWGLYAESLGEEMEMYEDPYDKFGQLVYEMWRAIRLVVDTGMHSMNWKRSDAIAFFKKYSSKTHHDVVVEVDRYIIWPGQALSYKIGELKIKELRKKAKGKLGENFDLREFHNQVLKNGALPLDILEKNIEQWASTFKGMPQG